MLLVLTIKQAYYQNNGEKMNKSICSLKTFGMFSFLGLCILASSVSAKEYVSQSKATEVIELYTSEGCSSCPPADRWLSTLKNRPELFKELIPMSFHVDYWDYIGWKDRFAKPAYSLRQRQYVKTRAVSQAYTPQMVANSGEWRAFISGQRQWVPNEKNVGVLKATIQDNADSMFVRFARHQPSFNASSQKKYSQYVLNVAVLGMGLTSRVTAGENHGNQLNHDFVVLNHQQQTVAANPAQWKMLVPKVPNAGQTQSAVAIWLSEPGTQKIIQATGGYL